MIFQHSVRSLPRDKEVAKDKSRYTKSRTKNSSPMGPHKERLARLRQLKAKQKRMTQVLRHQRFQPLLRPTQLVVGQALIWNNYQTADYKLINNKIWRMLKVAALSQWPSSLYNRWCRWECPEACLSLWIKDAVQEWCQYQCSQECKWDNPWCRKDRWTWLVVRWALTTARFQCICARSISLSQSWCTHEISLSARSALLNNL